MNQFNKKLVEAKKRQLKMYWYAAIGLVAVLLITVLAVFSSRGTQIDIFPQEARSQATISVSGVGFAFGGTIYSLASNPEIEVGSPGFKTTIHKIGKEAIGGHYHVNLFALPGRLIASTSISETATADKTIWMLGNKKLDRTGRLETSLEAGKYTLIADHPYFKLEEAEIEMVRGKETSIRMDLHPVPAHLEINSTPSGAALYIGQEKVGVTPFKKELPAGEYDLRITAANFQETNETVTLTRDKNQVIRNYRLALKKAIVTVDLNPSGGTLLVNGLSVKDINFKVDATVSHDLVYMKPGFYRQKQTISPAPDEKVNLKFHLKPEIGKVVVTSTPAAFLHVDGRNLGTTPVTLSLPAIPQKITLKKSGYRSVDRTVIPRGGAVQKINVHLVTEDRAMLKEAKVKLTNTAGIQLTQFRPNVTYTMGAPRSEKGQRANEFLRTVTLNKPFYASVYEITNQQFAAYSPQHAGGPANHPVTNISWQEAASFCNWLSQKENLPLFYKTRGKTVIGYNSQSTGYRLLSEAEWEWLARRAGKQGTTIFTWGDSYVIPPKTANVADESAKGQVQFYVPRYTDGYSGVAPVGSFLKEIGGLYDMGGNVSEWVHDVYVIQPPKKGEVFVTPLGVQNGHAHVVKGANFRSGTITTLRPAFREGLNTGRDDLGFRIGRYLF
ncbi:MAG: SUMF1/EgtB/PvdO family nonheme iron enzyme [Desulfobacterales bacterium]|nr:SUMF1/EgtB/PvdO family nonheme iron enzyme [Desulfobacterales bacterium]